MNLNIETLSYVNQNLEAYSYVLKP